jgi:ATP-dependent Clp protease protease subunit
MPPKKHSDRLSDILENGIDWKTRTLYIIGAIDDEKSFRLIPLIRLLDEGKGPIKVFLSSNGGDEAAGFAIFDTLRMCRNTVRIYGYGGVYSIAALIFQAGNLRLLAPNAQLMMHNGTMGVSGCDGSVDSNKIQQLGREAAQNDARYHKAIAERSSLHLTDVAGWCKDEKYFLAEEAVKYGLADRLIQPGDV